jgi:plasmid stabilization system protein ParE
MTYCLAVSAPAEADLAKACTWYRHIRPGLDAELAACVEQAFQRILENPKAFPTVATDVRRAHVRRFPYGVLFRLKESNVEIVAVFHGKRDPGTWQDRLSIAI